MGLGTGSRRVHLSPEVVKHLLHYFGDTNYGRDGGHFVNRLLQLVAVADTINRELLAEHWPEYVAGFEVAAKTPWGIDWLRSLAKAELDGDADSLLPLSEVAR